MEEIQQNKEINDTVIKMIKQGRNIEVVDIGYYDSDDKKLKKNYKQLISDLNVFYNKNGLKIHNDGYVYSNKSINNLPRQPYTELNFFIHPEKYIKYIDVNKEFIYKIFFKVHCIEKGECAYVIVDESNRRSDWLDGLPKNFRDFSKEGTLSRIIKLSLKLIREQKLSRSDALEYYVGSGWCLCNGSWIYNSLKDFKTIDNDSKPVYEDVLAILNKDDDMLIKSLLAYFILAINYEFLKEAKYKPEFILNIYGSLKSARIEKIVTYFNLPYNKSSEFFYNLDNQNRKKRNACLHKNKDKVIIANTYYIMDENPTEVRKRLKDNLDDLIYEIYYTNDENLNYSINSLVTIISQREIYERKCLAINGDKLDDIIFEQCKKISQYLGLIYKEYIKYIKEEILQGEYFEYSKDYINRIKVKYKRLLQDVEEAGNDIYDDNIKKITFLLLGYDLFINYFREKEIITNEAQADMLTDYKELLLYNFGGNIDHYKGHVTTKGQAEIFIRKIFDTYQSDKEMFINYKSKSKNNKYLGLYGDVRGQHRLIFKKDDVVKRFNMLDNIPNKLTMSEDQLYDELLEIGILYDFGTKRRHTSLQLNGEKDKTEVIQIVFDKLKDYLKIKQE